MNDDKLEAAVERIGDVLCDGIDELKAENERLRTNVRPSKPDAAKLATNVIDAWIKRRQISIHRDARTYLIDDMADAFGAPEVKEAEGVS